MSNARDRFIRSFHSLRHACRDNALVDRAVNERRHNQKAGILRNGLTVVAFATLEHFIRQRSAELIRHIGTHGPRFRRMPNNFRNELTSGVMQAVKFRAGLAGQLGDDVPDFIVSSLRSFARYRGLPSGFTGDHFGVGKSNLSEEDVARLLRLFQVGNGWQHVANCSQRVGAPILAPANQFDVAAQRRHRAAHDPAPSATSNDLIAFIDQSLVFGCAFDIVASHGVRTIAARLQPNRQVAAFQANNVRLRFIDRTDIGYREVVENAQRATALGPLLAPILQAARARSTARGEALVIRTGALRVRRWTTPV